MPLNEPLADDYWTERQTNAMGSTVHVVLGDAPVGLDAWAMEEVERLEQCWSRFRPGSELSRLNARAGIWTAASNTMLLALECAADLRRATRGGFDPTILDALERAGYDRTFAAVAADTERDVAPGEPAPGFANVEVDVAAGRVRVPVGTRLDLGGVGKGLAADLVTRGLVDRGARSALVSLGGDVRARGEAPDGAWRIPVEHPLDPARTAFVHPLAEAGLVTSTRRMRTWTRAGVEYHHIIDPRTGDSARTDVAAVVATAPDAWWAEGIAKAVMIAGLAGGAPLARTAGVHAWVFLTDGQMIEVTA